MLTFGSNRDGVVHTSLAENAGRTSGERWSNEDISSVPICRTGARGAEDDRDARSSQLVGHLNDDN